MQEIKAFIFKNKNKDIIVIDNDGNEILDYDFTFRENKFYPTNWSQWLHKQLIKGIPINTDGEYIVDISQFLPYCEFINTSTQTINENQLTIKIKNNVNPTKWSIVCKYFSIGQFYKTGIIIFSTKIKNSKYLVFNGGKLIKLFMTGKWAVLTDTILYVVDRSDIGFVISDKIIITPNLQKITDATNIAILYTNNKIDKIAAITKTHILVINYQTDTIKNFTLSELFTNFKYQRNHNYKILFNKSDKYLYVSHNHNIIYCDSDTLDWNNFIVSRLINLVNYKLLKIDFY